MKNKKNPMDAIELTTDNLNRVISGYDFSGTRQIDVHINEYENYNGYISFESVDGSSITISGEIILTSQFILLMGDSDVGIYITKTDENYHVMLIDSQKLIDVLKNIEMIRIKELDENTEFVEFSGKDAQIESCSICYQENVNGTKVDCCNRKQQICFECLFLHINNKYTERYIYDMDFAVFDNLKILLSYLVPCPFCRSDMNNYKYLYVFLENIDTFVENKYAIVFQN